MRINFKRNENGCFTDKRIAEKSISIKQLFSTGTEELNDKTLFIVVPTNDGNGNEYFEKVRVLLISLSECPFKDSVMIDENGNIWEIDENDIAFTDEGEANKFTLLYNMKLDIVKNNRELLSEVEDFIALSAIFGLPSDTETLKKIKDRLKEIFDTISANERNLSLIWNED